VVATVELARPHHATAWQHFTPGGPLAILPLSGDRASLVWTEETERAEALLALPAEAFESLLARRFGDALGLPRLIGGRFGYPLSRQLPDRIIAPSLALVGDAAHGAHPLAGQGLNLGLKDIAALVEILSNARELGEDFGGEVVLERYAQWRRLDVIGAVSAADVIARVFSNDIEILRLARRAALFAAQIAPGVKRWLALEAGGALGDAPKTLALG
jgi:2-octaprenyl-6-methoxyphenol hydroxylase